MKNRNPIFSTLRKLLQLLFPILAFSWPVFGTEDVLLDYDEQRQAALQAEANGRNLEAFELWEGIIDRCITDEIRRIEAIQRRTALREYVPPNTDPAKAKSWPVLVIIFRTLDFSYTDGSGNQVIVETSVSEEDEAKIRQGIQNMAEKVFSWSSGRLRIDAEIVVETSPLTKLSRINDTFWLAPWEIKETTDRLMSEKPYQAVFVYVKCRQGPNDPAAPPAHGGGAFGGDIGPRGAGFIDIPFYEDWLKGTGEIELHEWLHVVDWMFACKLDYPDDIVPSPDSGRMEGDDGGDQDFRRKPSDPDWMGFYRHLMVDHITRRMWEEASCLTQQKTPWNDTWLNQWLICGPFFSAPPEKPLDEDFIDEESVQPVPGALAGGLAWKEVPVPTKLVDFFPALGTHFNCAGYIATWVKPPQQMKARLRLGSDDGVKVFVNGSLVFANPAERGLRADQDEVPVFLNREWNSIILKINNIGGGWQGIARLTDPFGKPILGLTQSATPP